MPAKNSKKQPDPDWEAVGKDYIAHVMSYDAICKKYTTKKAKLNKSRLIYQMKKRGFDVLRKQAKQQLRETPIPDRPGNNVIVLDSIKLRNEYIQKHLNDLADRQDIAKRMTAALTNYMDALSALPVTATEEEIKERIPGLALLLGPKENVSDFFKRVSEISNKNIELERKVLGLDVEDEGDGLDSYEEQLRKLYHSKPEKILDGEFEEVNK